MKLAGAVVIVSLIIATCWAIIDAVPAPPPPQTKQDHCYNPSLGMFWPCDEIDRYYWV